MITSTHVLFRTDVSLFPARFTKAVSDIWGTMNRKYQQHRAIRHLSSLSDHHLKDIGIHRSEITSVVYGRGDDRSGHSRVY